MGYPRGELNDGTDARGRGTGPRRGHPLPEGRVVLGAAGPGTAAARGGGRVDAALLDDVNDGGGDDGDDGSLLAGRTVHDLQRPRLRDDSESV